MDKIDLHKILEDRFLVIENGKTVEAHTHLVIEAMKAAIHQALVLASERAQITKATRLPNGTWEVGIKRISKQSILDVEKLIV